MHPKLAQQISTLLGTAFEEAPQSVQNLLSSVSAEYERCDEERKHADTFHSAFFAMSRDLLLITDSTGQVLDANPAWATVLGFTPEELKAQSLFDLIHSDDLARTLDEGARKIRSREAVKIENRYRCKNGEYRWLAWSAFQDQHSQLVYSIGRDITDRRHLEMELRHAQKLEAVGQLASGVAHEINTPVQYIGDNVQFLKDSFTQLVAAVSRSQQEAPSPALGVQLEAIEYDYLQVEVPRALEAAREGVSRVAELVRALKEFSHPDQPERVPGDINKALQRTLTLARNEYKYVADVESSWGELPHLPCHVSELSQVFLNLIVNAAHAIDDRRKATGSDARGKIRVSTELSGEQVVVRISDTGAGIPENIRSRIFEPFFTTKEVGRGTGQGLAIARTIVVDKHRGTLEFETEVGVGTTFVVRLPSSAPAEAQRQAA